MPAALLFDLDGTMMMTDPIHRAVFADLLAPRGVVVDEAYYAAHIHGRMNLDFFAEAFPDEPDPQALSEAKEAEFRRRLPRPYPATPGLAALLARARAAGWETAVVTNAPRLNAEAMLEAIGVRASFDVIVSGEETPRGKPAPDPYLAAMRLLRVGPAESIAFEDSPAGLAAARASGAFTVGIGPDPAALRRAGAEVAIRDFTDPALEPVLLRLTGEAA